MKQSVILWIIAFFLTVASAVYQRVTGPTYPVSGTARIGSNEIAFRLERSHGGETDAPVLLFVDDPAVTGIIRWKRFRTDDPWSEVPMERRDHSLAGALPYQPPGGKLEYTVTLLSAGQTAVVLPGSPVVIRFRGDVPLFVLLPHILAMFLAMLLSTRTGLEVLAPSPSYRTRIVWTLCALFVGGMILGPFVQWYAFGKWWTGWPLGTDLTDNKTAIAFLGWVVAAAASRFSRHPRRWILGAAILLLAVYLIPHSVFGSELDYAASPATKHGP
jgi:hypothetical protein